MNPLLSICIPTYNRVNTLKQSLERLTSLQVFKESDELEIVISDNASSDGTEQFCRQLTTRFPEKIKYFRNDTNVRDENFHLALLRGKGDFLKLANDTLLFENTGICTMLQSIREHQQDKPVLYFRNLDTNDAPELCTSFDSFISSVGFMATWIAEFGIWRSDFEQLTDFARARDLQLIQADVMFRIVAQKQRALVVRRKFFSQIHLPSLGGYSAAIVFGQNYHNLLRPYVQSGLVSAKTLAKDKWLVFRYPILGNYLITSPRFKFTKSDYITSLWPEYKGTWYYWFFMPFALAAIPISRIRRLINR